MFIMKLTTFIQGAGRLKSISYKKIGKSTQKSSTLIDFNRPKIWNFYGYATFYSRCIKGCVSCTQEYVLEDFEYVLEDFELIWAKNIFSVSKIFLCPNWKFSYVTTEKKIQLKKKSKKKFLLIRFRRCRVDLSTFSKLGRLKSISYKIFGKSTQKWSTLIDFNRPKIWNFYGDATFY